MEPAAAYNAIFGFGDSGVCLWDTGSGETAQLVPSTGLMLGPLHTDLLSLLFSPKNGKEYILFSLILNLAGAPRLMSKDFTQVEPAARVRSSSRNYDTSSPTSDCPDSLATTYLRNVLYLRSSERIGFVWT